MCLITHRQMKTHGGAWGRMGARGDAWGRMGTHGDAWGRMGAQRLASHSESRRRMKLSGRINVSAAWTSKELFCSNWALEPVYSLVTGP
jgi:hypothetical protein